MQTAGGVVYAGLFALTVLLTPHVRPAEQPLPVIHTDIGVALDVPVATHATEPKDLRVLMSKLHHSMRIPSQTSASSAHDSLARRHDTVDVYFPRSQASIHQDTSLGMDTSESNARAVNSSRQVHPVLFFVHGGGWKSGHSRASRLLGLYSKLGHSLASRGFVVVVANYRKSVGPSVISHVAMALVASVLAAVLPNGWLPTLTQSRRRGRMDSMFVYAYRWASVAICLLVGYWALYAIRVIMQGDDRVRHPAHAADVAAALGWTVVSVGTYGGDPSQVVVVGHSAGAHLLLMLLVEAGRLRAGLALNAPTEAHVRRAVAGAVLIGGPYSAEAMRASWIVRSAIMRPVFGDDEEDWEQCFPVAHCRDANRVASLRLPPVLLVSAENEVPEVEDADRVILPLLHAGGVDARHVVATGTNHFSSVLLIGRYFARAERSVVNDIVGFARRCVAAMPDEGAHT